ncbi:hypothetical protein BB560_007265 [Smittium megazygosporum]|uniref:Uncharacterized protein n=1 Tax=Smittium megazygosporum TaxID=133381 RepID=A0A2T9XXH5_9FUNG|nr:hypothetical protein BB560_007265 [Smittium megazygosporum]
MSGSNQSSQKGGHFAKTNIGRLNTYSKLPGLEMFTTNMQNLESVSNPYINQVAIHGVSIHSQSQFKNIALHVAWWKDFVVNIIGAQLAHVRELKVSSNRVKHMNDTEYILTWTSDIQSKTSFSEFGSIVYCLFTSTNALSTFLKLTAKSSKQNSKVCEVR